MFFVLVCTTSCQDSNEMEIAFVHDFKKLEKTTLLQGTMELPIGTLWKYADADESEIQFKLPEGYLFLVYDNVTGKSVFSIDAGYSCTCTKNTQSCAAIYSEKGGFLCGRSNCSGTCEGKDVKSIMGIVEGDLANNPFSLETRASLHPDAMDIFLKNEQIANYIELVYNGAYLYKSVPNFPSADEINDYNKKDYVFLKTKMMGVHLAFFVPNLDFYANPEDQVQMKSQGFEIADSVSCDCSGVGFTCKMTKGWSLFTGSIYSCQGCSTCTMWVK